MSTTPGTAVVEAKDPLTGLSDRRTFLNRMRRECLRTMSSGGMMGVLVVNIDQFRRINSVFGLNVGDRVLAAVGHILNELVRRHDLVARIGSDEYALLLPGIMNEGHAVLAANKILRELQTPLDIDGERVPVSVTVGIALCPTHTSHAETLFKQAEMAQTRARRSGASYLVAEPVKAMEITDTWDLEIELESAVENEELELHYQPKVSLSDGSIQGVEALMRWNSPSRGLLLPGQFIHVAEETGRIQALTQWALNCAMREARDLRTRAGRDLPVSVNMPANAYQNPNLVDLVANVMKLWDAAPGALVLEVTESLAMADPEAAFDSMKRLREAGARIAIDDFGTGYSSLSHFRNIPADELKIDKVFVQRLDESDDDRSLVELMVDIGHRFGMTVVAEGVESQEILDRLGETNCDMIQGNLVSTPMPFDECCQWVEARGADWRAAT